MRDLRLFPALRLSFVLLHRSDQNPRAPPHFTRETCPASQKRYNASPEGNPTHDGEPSQVSQPIQQTVDFPASPETLFEIYMDSTKHSEATGSKAKIGRNAGDTFTAFEGMLEGKNLMVVPGKMIMQAWRSTSWKKEDPDSILVLTFTGVPTKAKPRKPGKKSKSKTNPKNTTRGRVELLHVNVPEHDHAGVAKGWDHFYWKPWLAYLAAKRK